LTSIIFLHTFINFEVAFPNLQTKSLDHNKMEVVQAKHSPGEVISTEKTSSSKDGVDIASICSDLTADLDESERNQPSESGILDTSPKSV
jgi:hypothetical protein